MGIICDFMLDNFNVLYISGDSYAPYTGISIFSLLENNKSIKNIIIHIFDMGISRINKDRLIDISNKYDSTVIFHRIFIEDIFDEFSISDMDEFLNGHYLNTYVKLLTSSLLPNIDKILFIDSDTIITGSFNELNNWNIDEYYIAAVLDLAVYTIASQHIKSNLNLDENDHYINSGLLYINLKKWRDNNLELKLKNYVSRNINKLILADQDVLNACIEKDEVLILPLKYNVLLYFYNFEYYLLNFNEKIIYSKNEVTNAIKNPIVIHFSGSNTGRPWYNSKWIDLEKFFFSKRYHKFNKEYKKYQELYFQYASLSPWKDDFLIKDKRLPLFKLLFLLRSIFPRFFSFLLSIHRKLFYK